MIVNKEKRTCQIMNFAVSVDHRLKLKESEMRYSYLDFAWTKKRKKKFGTWG